MNTEVKREVFPSMKLKKICILKRLLGFKLIKRALGEINNLLSESDLMALTPEDVNRIKSKYCVGTEKDFVTGLHAFYKEYLQFCLRDRFLSNREVKELMHLKTILSIEDEEAARLHNVAAGEYYKMEVEKAIEDGRLDEDEKDFLKKVKKALKLSDTAAKKIFQNSAYELLHSRTKEALEDERLTADEEKELDAIRKSLGIEQVKEGSMRANYEKYKLFWQIENGQYPVLEADIDIAPDEPCHFYTHAEWLEQNIEASPQEINAFSARLSLPDKWRVEDKEIQPALEDIWATLDNGRMYLTGRKIMLVGVEGEQHIYLDQIVDFTAYKNGVIVIEKQKSVFIQFRDHIDIFSMLLGKCILHWRSEAGETHRVEANRHTDG